MKFRDLDWVLNEMEAAVTMFAQAELKDPKDIEGFRSQLVVYYDNRLKNQLQELDIDDSDPKVREKIVKRRDDIIERICTNMLR